MTDKIYNENSDNINVNGSGLLAETCLNDGGKERVAVITLGCKVNQYDSDAMLSTLTRGGFKIAEGYVPADFYIVNTCAVTAEAERKSRQSVGKILKINPKAKIYICGCAAQNNFSQFSKNNVVFISGTDGKLNLAKKLIEDRNEIGIVENLTGVDCFTSDFTLSGKYEDNDGIVNLRTRHFMKIQDGCDNFCSYCIVPYLRGRSRSRSVESVKRELDGVAGTAKEIVLTGINLSAYGKESDFSLTRLLIELKGYDFRIRFGSLEESVICEEFLDATKDLKAFCPHFHLSLQSGDDGVLKDMNRRYTTEQYINAVALIRKYYPNAGVTTDIIVGFPTESRAAFENSLDFARNVAFSDIHVFPYSSRKGTVAGKLPVLSVSETEERQRRMSALKKDLITEFLLKQLNCEHEVLFEMKEDGMWCGHTPNYVKVYSETGARNDICIVIPTRLYRDGVMD